MKAKNYTYGCPTIKSKLPAFYKYMNGANKMTKLIEKVAQGQL